MTPTRESVLDALCRCEDVSVHGARAADVSQVIGRPATWKAVYPVLEELAADGLLHRVIPRNVPPRLHVPHFRRVGS